MRIEDFSSLLGAIYEAALEPPKWRNALKGVCEFVSGSPSASLFWQDAPKKKGHAYFVWGGDPKFAQLYWEKHNNVDPLTVGASSVAIGEIYSASDITSREQLVRSPFYEDWLAPQGWSDVMCVNLDRTATGRAVFVIAVPTKNALPEHEIRRRMALLVPHVQRSVFHGRLINLSRIEAAALTDTLDGLDAAMFLVDAAGQLVHANASGQAMLDSGNALYANGKLVASATRGDAPRVHFPPPEDRTISLNAKEMAVQLAVRGGSEFVTHVLPLAAGARRKASVPYSAVAAIFVQRAGRPSALSLEMLATQFGLTQGELRVLMAMTDATGVPKIAAALKLSQATVRTHLSHIFEKTGARRQADLVRLITSNPAPIVMPAQSGAGATKQ